MKKILNTISAAAVVLFSASCEHKELCYDHSHAVDVDVVFDWTSAPEADPESMSVYLYPTNGGSPLRYDFTGRDGGTIRVPSGNYEALCLNSDTEVFRYRNTESCAGFEVYTQAAESLGGLGVSTRGLPRAAGAEEEEIVMPVDSIWCTSLPGVFSPSFTDSEQGRKLTLTLAPEVGWRTYTVTITNPENIQYTVGGLSATLSGFAGGLHPADRSLTEERVTIPFELTVEQEIGEEHPKLTGSFSTFGHCPTVAGEHKLVVYAVLADNSKWYYTVDVTEQIHSAADLHHIYLYVDGLPLPKPLVNGGGFQPTVDDWQPVDIEIQM